jgi:hypothetical protein
MLNHVEAYEVVLVVVVVVLRWVTQVGRWDLCLKPEIEPLGLGLSECIAVGGLIFLDGGDLWGKVGFIVSLYLIFLFCVYG